MSNLHFAKSTPLRNIALRRLFPFFKKKKHAEENRLRHETLPNVAVIVESKFFGLKRTIADR